MTTLDLETTPADELLTLPKAARLLPPIRGNVAPSTLWRWATVGLYGLRLPVAMMGRTSLTTRAALFAFLRETEAARRAGVPAHADPGPVQSPAARRKAYRAAERRLESDHGVKVKRKAKAAV